MSEPVYDLSGLIQIVPSTDLHKNVHLSIANQLAGLSPQNFSDADYRLLLKPYESRGGDSAQSVGGVGTEIRLGVVDFEDRQFAVEFEEKQITLYLGISGVPLNPWMQLLLAPQGISMVHAAAIERDGQSLLLPAFGGAGKTLATGLLIRDHGYRFLGDDIVMINRKGEVLPFPRPLFFYDHHTEVFQDYFARRKSTVNQYRMIGKFKRKLVRGLPLKQAVKSVARTFGAEGALRRAAATREYLDAGSAQEVFGLDALGEGGPLSSIIFLQRYTGNSLEFQPTTSEQLVQRMFAILMNEWKAEWPQIVTAAGYGATDLATHYENTTSIMRDCVSGVPVKTLMIPRQATPYEYVPKLLED